MSANEEYHQRHRKMFESMRPINNFDPDVEQVAKGIWNSRGLMERYLIEWEHITRPFREEADCPAVQVLRDAQAIVTARRARIHKIH